MTGNNQLNVIALGLIFSLTIGFCSAQNQFGKYIDVNAGFGTFLPHKQGVKHLQSGPSIGGEVSYTLRTDGSDFHHSPYRLPYFGVMIGIADGGNREIIGLEGYATAFGSIPLYRDKNPLVIKMGLGLGYVEGIYDKYNNPKQNAIGSHFNTNIQLRFEKNFRLFNGGGFNAGIGISHYSNASFQTPNLGLNYVHVYLGKRFTLQECVPIPDSMPVIAILPYSPKKFEFDMHFGAKENPVALGDKFLLMSASGGYTRQFSIKHAWSNGLDIYYNKALYHEEGKLMQIGISSSYVLNFDEIKIGAGLGIYLLGRPDISRGFYSNVFFQHFFKHRWFAKINLKTHRVVADFFTIGIGYAL